MVWREFLSTDVTVREVHKRLGELSGLLMNCNKNILKAICAVVIDLTDVARYDGKEATSLTNDFDAEAINEKIEGILRNYKTSFTQRTSRSSGPKLHKPK